MIDNFHHQSERPTEPGDYLLYNQCDGYHVVVGFLDEDGRLDLFRWMGCEPISDDFYQAWMKLPNTLRLYERFADKPTDGKSAYEVTLERLARQEQR